MNMIGYHLNRMKVTHIALPGLPVVDCSQTQSWRGCLGGTVPQPHPAAYLSPTTEYPHLDLTRQANAAMGPVIIKIFVLCFYCWRNKDIHSKNICWRNLDVISFFLQHRHSVSRYQKHGVVICIGLMYLGGVCLCCTAFPHCVDKTQHINTHRNNASLCRTFL